MQERAKRQHEEFDVKSDLSAARKKIVRQDRLNVEDLNCWVEWNGQQYKLANISAFGAAFFHDANIGSVTDLRGLQFGIETSVFSETNARIIRTFETEPGKYQIGIEVVGEPISMDRFKALVDSTKIVQTHEAEVKRNQVIPKEFKIRVLETQDWLADLQDFVNKQENSKGVDEGNGSHEYDDAFAENVGSYLCKVMPAKNEYLQDLLPKDPDVLKASIEFFREKLYHLIYQAPFSNRVFHKPLGYAGDYEMMNIIYRDEANGKNLFAKCLNNYWIAQPAAQAVRNRANYLVSRISKTFDRIGPKDSAKFMSVACGPAMEWQRMISEIGEYNERMAEVHLLDQDEGALKHAHRQVKVLSHQNANKFKFSFLNSAIKNVIGRGLEDKDYDLIYSAGLFDYFSEPVAQMAARRLYESLRPGGQLIIGNFNVSNPNSLMMNLALDWQLIYRSVDDLKRLFGPIGGDLTIEKEDLDINLFCVITKK